MCLQKRYRHEFNERKAGENEDQGQWKGAVRYERAEDEFFPGTRVSDHLLLLFTRSIFLSLSPPSLSLLSLSLPSLSL